MATGKSYSRRIMLIDLSLLEIKYQCEFIFFHFNGIIMINSRQQQSKQMSRVDRDSKLGTQGQKVTSNKLRRHGVLNEYNKTLPIRPRAFVNSLIKG